MSFDAGQPPVGSNAGAEGSWFATEGPATRAAPATAARVAWPVLALFAAALLAVAAFRGLLLRALLPIALAVIAVAALVRRRRAPPPAVRPRGLRLSGRTLSFERHGAPPVPILERGAPFGVTLLATPGRERLLVAVTSQERTFYVGATFDEAARRAHAALLARTFTVARDELGLVASGPDNEPVELSPDDAARLVSALAALEEGCLDRCVLTDQRGAPVLLDAAVLEVGGRAFDLGAPLEWRPFVFQEQFGASIGVYQATSVRQGGAEACLVCALPSLSALVPAVDASPSGIPEIDSVAVRDLKLMHSLPDEPPARELRVAIDRLFMLPLRAALDRAPRPSQQPTARA